MVFGPSSFSFRLVDSTKVHTIPNLGETWGDMAEGSLFLFKAASPTQTRHQVELLQVLLNNLRQHWWVTKLLPIILSWRSQHGDGIFKYPDLPRLFHEISRTPKAIQE